MRPEREFSFTYKDLATAIDKSVTAVHQHVSRGVLDPEDIASLAVYLATYGPEELRLRIVTSAIRKIEPDDPGGWKKSRSVVKGR